MTRLLPLTVVALAVLLTAAPARADGTLEEALADLARDVKTFLTDRQTGEVAIRQLTSTGHLPASAGLNLQRELARHLAQAGIDVKPVAAFLLTGEYKEVEDEAGVQQAVQLTLEIRDRGDNKTTLRKRFVKNEVTLAVLLGLTLQHPPDAGPRQQKEEVKRSIDQPATHFQGTVLRAAAGSPFGIELLVRGTDGKYTPRAPEDKSGLAFVPLRRTEVYAVRLINDNDFEAAVSLHIDGLSMFVFSDKDPKTKRPLYTHLLVPPKQSVLVEGWHIAGKEWDRFLVVGYGEKVKDKPEENAAAIGTITANFHAAWKKGATPPPGEPKENAQGAPPDQTGRGERYYQEIQPQEREIGRQRAAVSVRYSR